MLAITEEELSQALGKTVERIEVELIGEFSCELWRLNLSLSDGCHRSLVLKRPRQEPGRDSMEAERRFYQRYGSSLPAAPEYLGYLPSVDGILLEHVANLVHFDWRAGPSPTHARASLTALAELHGVDPGDVDWLSSFDQQYAVELAREYDIAWRERRDLLLGYCPEFAISGDYLVGRTEAPLISLRSPRCLLHGDAHGENLPQISTGGVCMLDWQDPILGNPGIDVADYLIMSFDSSERRSVQHELVAFHAQLLDRADYDSEFSYRLGALQRVVRTVRGAHAFPGWAESSLPWVFQRCATAALDADVAGLV